MNWRFWLTYVACLAVPQELIALSLPSPWEGASILWVLWPMFGLNLAFRRDVPPLPCTVIRYCLFWPLRFTRYG